MPKTKAEASFDRKLKHLLREERPLDTGAVSRLFEQFGTYLELTDWEPPKMKRGEEVKLADPVAGVPALEQADAV